MTGARLAQIKESIESSQHNGWAAELLAALEAERATVERLREHHADDWKKYRAREAELQARLLDAALVHTAFLERAEKAEVAIARVQELCNVVETDTMRERPRSERGCFQRGIHAKAREILAALNNKAERET